VDADKGCVVEIRKNRLPFQKHALKKQTWILFFALALVVILGSMQVIRYFASRQNGGPLLTPTEQARLLPDGSDAANSFSPPAENLPSTDPWDEPGRVTVLVMGVDYGDWESADRVGPPRSDTMILLTVDPVQKTAGMLSIPRDLWVSMPGFPESHKINTAHRFGDLYDLTGGGPGLAMLTVEELLGVPINFYASIDFYAFEEFIDELGGVSVDVPQEIKVDPLGPGNTLVLEPGRQMLDGATALAYARNRSTANDDFDRTRRQQQVILATRERILSLEMLPRLVFKAPALYRQLREGVRTNLTLEQAVRLAWLTREIPAENIQRAAIDSGEVTSARDPEGAVILLPIPDRISAVVDEVFSSSIPGQPQGMTVEELVAAEASRVTIVNESGQAQLGGSAAQYLRDKGVNVIEVVQAEKTRAKTRIVDRAHNPYSTRFLFNLLKTDPAEIWNDFDLEAGTDLVVYLGEDWALPEPTPGAAGG